MSIDSRTFTDQIGRTIKVRHPPRRIVSLVPSQTELLAYLELDEEVVGITKFCIYPEYWCRNKPKMGGTKHAKIEVIEQLEPDLIIANKEENDKGQIEALAEHFPVWVSDVHNLEDALGMIRAVGKLTGKEERAAELAREIARRFEKLEKEMEGGPSRRAAYFVWRNPYMVAGNDTFIHDMIQRSGFENVFGDRDRYPEVTLEELSAADPEVILLASEPYLFRKKHLGEFSDACPKATLLLIDGGLFSWYGSRLLKAPAYFQEVWKREA
jgi:ABC-type Fe3+-hydroxamate transport system substrate-binding protein